MLFRSRGEESAQWTLDPREYGLAASSAAELAGGSSEDNARLIEAVLTGRANCGARAAVLLNAGAAVYVSGLVDTFEDALDRATASLESGEGLAALNRLRSAYNQ